MQDNMNNYFKHLEQFAKATEITYDEMKDIVLTKNEPFKIYSFKKNGTRIVREMFSVSGPGGFAMGGVKYWLKKINGNDYMIFYDLDKDDYRTICLNKVYKITKFGKTYLIK